MLEGIAVVVGVIIKVVGIGKKVAATRKNVGRTYILARKVNFFGIAYMKTVLFVEIEVFAGFETQIGIGLAVAHYFNRILYPYRPVVGSYEGARSEERRVGKECRYWWWWDH